MGRRWGGLVLGDVVARAGRSREMVVTDLDLDDPRAVTCAWREAGRAHVVHERTFRISGLVRLRRAQAR